MEIRNYNMDFRANLKKNNKKKTNPNSTINGKIVQTHLNLMGLIIRFSNNRQLVWQHNRGYLWKQFQLHQTLDPLPVYMLPH